MEKNIIATFGGSEHVSNDPGYVGKQFESHFSDTTLFTFRKMFVGGLSWQTTEGIFQISKTNQLEIDSSRGTQRILFQVRRSL